MEASNPPSTKTVPSTRRQHHPDSFSVFAADLREATKKPLPTGAAHFSQVTVIGLTWSNDSTGRIDNQRDLFKVLLEKYNFRCISYVIDHTEARLEHRVHRDMMKLNDKYDVLGALTIVVYSGHASASVDGRVFDLAGQVHTEEYGMLKGAQYLVGPHIRWDRIRSSMELVLGRRLLIFDSCSSIVEGIIDGDEILAAAGPDLQLSSLSSTVSLTKVLTEQFQALGGQPRSVSQIYTEILRKSVNSLAAVHPIHTLRREESIVLEPMPTSPRPFATRSSTAYRTRALQETGSSNDKILISVTLSEEVQVQHLLWWKTWLVKQLPHVAASITIEAVFDSFSSTTLLVAMPYEVWDGMPSEQPAYNFVGFIKSGNRLLAVEQSKDPCRTSSLTPLPA